MMDKLATRAVEEYVHAGYDLEAERSCSPSPTVRARK
jgi:hypothetical protein